MAKKFLLIIAFLSILTNISSQENDNYLLLLNELNNLVNNNFVSPFKNNNVEFINNNYWGFGYKKHIFTGQIRFNNFGVILCNINEEIYSMTDGIIIKIGYNENSDRIIVIKYGEIEIYYLLVQAININEGDIIKRGQLIGKITSPYYSRGPTLELKIKYKEEYFDPYLLLFNIIMDNR
jgi:hypothetical protein